MKNYRIGEVIQRRRRELNITQEMLCEGICEPSTLSKIENGRQNPSKRHLDTLLQRMGLSSETYYAFVTSDDFEVQELEHKIMSCIMCNHWKDALALLNQLESYEVGDPLIEQFILRERTIIGHYEDGILQPYSDASRLELLNKAIKLTVPLFQIDNISKYLLCTEELKVILNIATIYSEKEDYESSIKIFGQLMKYIEDKCMSMEETAYMLPLIAYDYSRDLGRAGQYQMAMETRLSHKHFKTCTSKQWFIRQASI